jgi:acyl carrier protein
MADRREATRLVEEVIDELNQLLPGDQPLAKAPATVILGEAGSLDSMSIVNLIVALDNKLEKRLGRPVTLTEDPRLFEKDGVLGSVGRMTDLVLEIMNRR